MLGTIEDQDPSVSAHCRDQVRILRLVASLVDLARVVDTLNDVEREGTLLSRTMASNLALLIIIVGGLRGLQDGDIDFRDLEVVLGVVRGVGAEQNAVLSEIRAGLLSLVRQPLCSEGRPLQSATAAA